MRTMLCVIKRSKLKFLTYIQDYSHTLYDGIFHIITFHFFFISLGFKITLFVQYKKCICFSLWSACKVENLNISNFFFNIFNHFKFWLFLKILKKMFFENFQNNIRIFKNYNLFNLLQNIWVCNSKFLFKFKRITNGCFALLVNSL